MTILIIIGIVIYLFVGGIIANLIELRDNKSKAAVEFVPFFWLPMLLWGWLLCITHIIAKWLLKP